MPSQLKLSWETVQPGVVTQLAENPRPPSSGGRSQRQRRGRRVPRGPRRQRPLEAAAQRRGVGASLRNPPGLRLQEWTCRNDRKAVQVLHCLGFPKTARTSHSPAPCRPAPAVGAAWPRARDPGGPRSPAGGRKGKGRSRSKGSRAFPSGLGARPVCGECPRRTAGQTQEPQHAAHSRVLASLPAGVSVLWSSDPPRQAHGHPAPQALRLPAGTTALPEGGRLSQPCADSGGEAPKACLRLSMGQGDDQLWR